MKIYKVKVNGKVYEVELESVTEVEGSIQPAKQEEAKPVAKPVASTGAGVELKAPMQGTIISVNVAAGDEVKKGQVVAVLEAMKLENEIVANADGVVKEVLITKGQTVDNQQVILIIG